MGEIITDPAGSVGVPLRSSYVNFTEQIVWRFQFFDLQGGTSKSIEEITKPGSVTRITLTTTMGDQTAEFTGGESLYIQATTVGNTAFGIVDSSTFSGGKTLIDLTTDTGLLDPAPSSGNSWVLVVARDHQLSWKLYDKANSVDVSDFLPFNIDNTGDSYIDVGRIAQDYMRKNDYQYLWYDFIYESNDISGGFAETTFAQDYMAIDGRLGTKLKEEVTGESSISNAKAFIISRGTPTSRTTQGCWPLTKFITDLDNENNLFNCPKHWSGWSSKFYYIFDNNLAFTTVYIKGYRIGSLTITSVISTQTYTVASTDPQILEYEIPISETLVGWLGAEIMFSDNSDRTTSSRKISVVAEHEEPNNPVMIRWKNSLGGYSQWLFGINGIVTTSIYKTGSKEFYQEYTSDFGASGGSLKQVTHADTIQRLTLKASNLTEGQARAIREVFSSNEVQIFINKEGTDLLNVTVPQQDYEYFRSPGKDYSIEYHPSGAIGLGPFYGPHTISIDVDLPVNTDFYNVKLY